MNYLSIEHQWMDDHIMYANIIMMDFLQGTPLPSVSLYMYTISKVDCVCVCVPLNVWWSPNTANGLYFLCQSSTKLSLIRLNECDCSNAQMHAFPLLQYITHTHRTDQKMILWYHTRLYSHILLLLKSNRARHKKKTNSFRQTTMYNVCVEILLYTVLWMAQYHFNYRHHQNQLMGGPYPMFLRHPLVCYTYNCTNPISIG